MPQAQVDHARPERAHFSPEGAMPGLREPMPGLVGPYQTEWALT